MASWMVSYSTNTSGWVFRGSGTTWPLSTRKLHRGEQLVYTRIRRGGVFGVLYNRSGEEKKRGSVVALTQRLDPFPRAILLCNDRFKDSNTMNVMSIMLVGLLLWLVFGVVVSMLTSPMLKERIPARSAKRPPKIPAMPVPTFPSPDSGRRYLN
jgi:hypothetical protein